MLLDLFIIGGGINGAAIARDAVGRGLSVMLAEKNDYASATSSSSSKLIHGGLRYLEHFEFSLVREALSEREIMLKIAPHLVHPMQFLVPITQEQTRPAWMVWMGLKLYDLLSGRKLLAKSGRLSKQDVDALPRLRPDGLSAVLHYPDCWVDDARLVLETLLDARARGADISNQRTVEKIIPADDGYFVHYTQNNKSHVVQARFVVNTAGPWANDIAGITEDQLPTRKLRLVRGSHIVLKMPQPADSAAYTLQNTDGRVVFTIPWLNSEYLVIGTTDAPHEGDPAKAECSTDERDYLLKAYNKYFAHPGGKARAADIVWSWAGVRPLIDDGKENPSKVTRSARMFSKQHGNGGFLTLYGGKLTTHRRMAEKMLKELEKMGAHLKPGWTSDAPLHGGRYDRDTLTKLAAQGPKNIPAIVRQRWAFTYGDQIDHLFEAVRADAQLAHTIAPGVTEAELRHVVTIEDARCAEDFLIRRTKLALSLSKTEKNNVENWFSNNAL